MKKALLTLLFSSLILVAADVTGAWSGTAKVGPDGPDSVYLTLKQQGATVTGSIGRDANDQQPIEKGRMEGDQITFEVPREGVVYQVLLKLQPDGKTLTGGVEIERDGAKHMVQLELKRQ